jgi:hypothetical protein
MNRVPSEISASSISTHESVLKHSTRMAKIVESLEHNNLIANLFIDTVKRPSMLNTSNITQSYGILNYYVVEVPSDEDQDLYRNEFSEDEFGEDDDIRQPTVNEVCEKMIDLRTIYNIVFNFFI